jgi:NtrC-family two-component system sensor histidine kinase KinB
MSTSWTLRKKILIGYGIALVLMVVVLVWGFASLFTLGRATEAILRENYRSILAAENMINSIERQGSATLLVVFGYQDEGLKQYRESETSFMESLGRAKDNITIPGEDKIVTAIEQGYAAYLAAFSQLEVLRYRNPENVASFYHESVLPCFSSVRDACVHLRQVNQDTMFTASDRARGIAGNSMWSMGIIGVVAIGIVLGFSLLLSALVVQPVRRVMEAAQRISEGNYEVEISPRSSDELGSLASEFNAMARKLRAYRDLNIRQIMEEKTKSEAILQSIDDGIVVVDADGKVADMNLAAAAALGVEAAGWQGAHFLEVVKNEDLFQYIKESMKSGQPPRIGEGEDVFTVAEGETKRHYQFSIIPVHEKTGRMLGVVLLFRDVTKLKELDRLKSEFVMAASHELRTPLTSIDMSINLLKDRASHNLNLDEQQLLTVAHEELQRIKALVNDLLDLSKIEAGKMDLAFDRVPIDLLCEKATMALKIQADEKGIELTCELPEGLPEVRADANKVTWILTNLIANALRYTEHGGHIRVAAQAAGSQVHVSVEDDGAGIPYEYQSKIFDKFVKVKGDQGTDGTGLGLTICKEIVRAHGGTIWVDSKPGTGSTFTFTLPIVE